ncbi:MAG: hypothetical protein MZU97_06055 [Bacillus subtilis]|nr:hypothetical protein [Bacillus subtilis]
MTFKGYLSIDNQGEAKTFYAEDHLPAGAVLVSPNPLGRTTETLYFRYEETSSGTTAARGHRLSHVHDCVLRQPIQCAPFGRGYRHLFGQFTDLSISRRRRDDVYV